MNSRVSWSVDGIDPSVRERAEAAARRAGMSLSDWLNSTVGEPAPPPGFSAPPSQRPAMPSRESRGADISARIDHKQIGRFRGPRARRDAASEASLNDPPTVPATNEAIRASTADVADSNPRRTRQPICRKSASDRRERARPVYRPPPLTGSPGFCDRRIAAARTNSTLPPPRLSAAHAAPSQAAMQPRRRSGLFFARTAPAQSQQTTRCSVPSVEESIAAFRSELAEIRRHHRGGARREINRSIT